MDQHLYDNEEFVDTEALQLISLHNGKETTSVPAAGRGGSTSSLAEGRPPSDNEEDTTRVSTTGEVLANIPLATSSHPIVIKEETTNVLTLIPADTTAHHEENSSLAHQVATNGLNTMPGVATYGQMNVQLDTPVGAGHDLAPPSLPTSRAPRKASAIKILKSCFPFFRHILKRTTLYSLLFISFTVVFGVLKLHAMATSNVIVGNELDWIIGIIIALLYVPIQMDYPKKLIILYRLFLLAGLKTFPPCNFLFISVFPNMRDPKVLPVHT